MSRTIIYQHFGSPEGFKDLRILWDHSASLATLYYETSQTSAYGSVFSIEEAIDYIERMQQVMGYPWTSLPVSEALKALEQLKEARPSQEEAEDEALKKQVRQAS